MTRDQFERLVIETRLGGAAAAAAQHVLCDGWTQQRAAEAFSVDQAAVSRVVQRIEQDADRVAEMAHARLLWVAGALRDGLSVVAVSERAEAERLLSRLIAMVERSG